MLHHDHAPFKSIKSYLESKGTNLATYAARCIENEILMHLRALKKKSRKDGHCTVQLVQIKRVMK